MKFLGRMNSQSKRSLTSVAISNLINSELRRYWLATSILPDSFSTFPTTTHGWLKKSMILNHPYNSVNQNQLKKSKFKSSLNGMSRLLLVLFIVIFIFCFSSTCCAEILSSNKRDQITPKRFSTRSI